jgi:hypothetical protein
MSKLRLLLPCAISGVCSLTIANPQVPNTWPPCQSNEKSSAKLLVLNKPIPQKLSTGGFHRYQLDLKAGGFVVVRVDQRGIDSKSLVSGAIPFASFKNCWRRILLDMVIGRTDD